MKRQRGLSLGFFIVVCFLVVLTSILGFKLATPYMEYFKVQNAIKAMASNAELKTASVREIQQAFERYAVVDNITSVSSADLDIEKDGGNIFISASYSVKVPLVANVSLWIDFTPSSAE